MEAGALIIAPMEMLSVQEMFITGDAQADRVHLQRLKKPRQ